MREVPVQSQSAARFGQDELGTPVQGTQVVSNVVTESQPQRLVLIV